MVLITVRRAATYRAPRDVRRDLFRIGLRDDAANMELGRALGLFLHYAVPRIRTMRTPVPVSHDAVAGQPPVTSRRFIRFAALGLFVAVLAAASRTAIFDPDEGSTRRPQPKASRLALVGPALQR
jgi:hypothetical protein